MGAAEWRNFSAGVGASAPEIMRRAFRQGPSKECYDESEAFNRDD